MSRFFPAVLCLALSLGASRGVVASQNLLGDAVALGEAPRLWAPEATVRWRAAQAGDLDLPAQSRLTLPLFDDLSVTVRFVRLDRRGERNWSWFGSIEGDPRGWAVFVQRDDALVGHIRTHDRSVYVRTYEPGILLIEEEDPSGHPGCGGAAPARDALDTMDQDGGPGHPGEQGEVVLPDDSTVIELMVVYTPAAIAGAGGESQLQARIQMHVDETNIAYANSQILQRVYLVHTQEVNYTESGDGGVDLDRLRDRDGIIDEVHDIRDQYCADIVHMYVEEAAGICGVAFLMTNPGPGFANWAFGVDRRSCSWSTIAHEMGHNMGSSHDRNNGGGGAYDYSYGYQYPNGEHRTVMAYRNGCGSPCTEIQHFSNPEVSFAGQPTGVPEGDPESADAAKTLNNTAPFVANFRNSIVECCDPAQCVDDGLSCTVEQCVAGQGCVSVPDDGLCDDSVACTLDACHDQLGCQNLPDPTACADDGIACTEESCDPTQGCITTPNDSLCVDDGVSCTVETCDGSQGCRSVPTDAMCADDGLSCTVESCDAVNDCQRVADDALCPDDGFACTVESCDPVQGCLRQPDDGLCASDGIACTVESCDLGAGCVSTPDDAACADGSECTLDVCEIPAGCGSSPRELSVTSFETPASACAASSFTFLPAFADSGPCTNPQYQWRVDGNVLPGETGPTLATAPDLPPGDYQVGVEVWCDTGACSVLSSDMPFTVEPPTGMAPVDPLTGAIGVSKDAGGFSLFVFDTDPVTATHWSLYAGELGSWYSHEPRECWIERNPPGTSFFSTPLADQAGSSYFLLSPANCLGEGTLGTGSNPGNRPLDNGTAPCGAVP